MADADGTAPGAEEDRFLAYLRWAHEEVRTWPEWKRDLLGWHRSKKKAIGRGYPRHESTIDGGPPR